MGTEDLVRLRRLRAGETATVGAVFAGLSPDSRYRRFHGRVEHLTDSMLTALAAADGNDHLAVVAEVGMGDDWCPVGIGRLVRTEGPEAELAVEVVDACHGLGIGRRLVEWLRDQARPAGIATVVASILIGNRPMLQLMLDCFPDAWIIHDGRTWDVRATVPTPPVRAARPRGRWHRRALQRPGVPVVTAPCRG